MTLKANDLKDLVDNVIEIDSYQSKMGKDEDVVTVTFTVTTQPAADDLVSFLEKGSSLILDADCSSGELIDGTYKVFIELERNIHIIDTIMNIIQDVTKLCGIDEFRYRYYKSFRSKVLNSTNLKEIPTSADEYITKTSINKDNYSEFFNKSYVENISLSEDIITISKKWTEPIRLKFIDFGPAQSTLENIKESFNANSFAEIIYLSKYIGDYNITKYGNKLTLENNGNVLVVERLT